jgi:3-oxoacyl-[acyl-carrier-protein] synthase III
VSVGILGLGAYLPERVESNADVEAAYGYQRAEHSGLSLDAWVRAHHGAVQRRRAAEGQATSDLATGAARAALEDAGLQPSDLDLIVMATITSDQRLPPSAALVQASLGSSAKFLQLDSACTGFLDSVQVAIGLMGAFGYRTALVVCADTTAFCIAPGDWLTATVFGDAGAAVVLREVPEGQGFVSFQTGSDGSLGGLVSIPGCGSRRAPSAPPAGPGHLHARWGKIHGWAVPQMVDASVKAVASAGLSLEDVDWVVPHQASMPIVCEAAQRLGVSPDRVVLTYPEYGNTVASSLPLALHHADRRGLFKEGDRLLLCAVGAGMAWSASVYRWSDSRARGT